MIPRPKLIAVVGGSGAGKSWLSQRLQQTLGLPMTRLTLDDFYRDQSHLPPDRRKSINFDHPRMIDWRLAEKVLQDCRAGRPASVPRYSFATHTRQKTLKTVSPKTIILVDGLWLLWRPRLRRLFDFRIFVHCPARLRLSRRLERDIASRGRDGKSVRLQFHTTVAPMHLQFVAPQARWGDIVLRQPVEEKDVVILAAMIREKICLAQTRKTKTRA